MHSRRVNSTIGHHPVTNTCDAVLPTPGLAARSQPLIVPAS